MAKAIRPVERIEQLDKLWSWIERFGLVKTVLGGAVGGGIFTFAVSRFQQFPRWLILGLVFFVSSLLLLILFAGAVWLTSFIQKQVKELASTPLRKRVIALEQSIGPRRISEIQRKHLLEELSKKLGRIRISAVSQDEDAIQYAEQFASVFREAGWNVWGVDRPYAGSRWEGDIGLILLTTEKGITTYPAAQNFAEALEAVNVVFRYTVTFELVEDSCELIVGYRGEATS